MKDAIFKELKENTEKAMQALDKAFNKVRTGRASLNLLDGTPDSTPLVAADIIGAGVGETVLIVGGSSARSAAGDMSIPVDASVVGIVDGQEIDLSVL